MEWQLEEKDQMGFEAYTYDDGGTEVIPRDRAEWQDWVSASKTRNRCKHDPLLDWLDRYGMAKGFVQDTKSDERVDFRGPDCPETTEQRRFIEHLVPDPPTARSRSLHSVAP